jgi:hypothetical protein
MSLVKLSDKLYFGIHPTVVKPQIIINNYIDFTEPGQIKSFVFPKN